MTALLIISAIAIGYAIIRAKRDSLLSHGDGKWKTRAFVFGVFIAVCSVSLTIWATKTHWVPGILLGLVFAFVFWIVFDCVQGYIRTGNILHIGTVGFDLRVRNAVKGKLWAYLFWKCFLLAIFTLGYFSAINTY